MLQLSKRTVTGMFEKESGVLIISRESTLNKRRYRTLRIPRGVYERVLRRLSAA